MPNIHSSLPNVQRPAIPSFSRAVKTSHEHTSNAFLVIILPFGALVVGFVAVGVIAIGAKLPFSVVLISSGSLALIFLFGTTLWVIFGRLVEGKEEIFGPDAPAVASLPPVYTHFGLPMTRNFTKYGEYPIAPDLLIEWCTAAVQLQSLSHEVWDKKFATAPGLGDGREKYTAFRAWLVANKYAEEVGGNVGLRIRWNNKEAMGFILGFSNVNPEDGTPLLEAETTRGKKRGHTQADTYTHTEQKWGGDEDSQEE